jgi:hypothetical protein
MQGSWFLSNCHTPLAVSKGLMMPHPPRALHLVAAALVQELLHNKTQSASSRTRMLLMIRSSAVCLLNTISTAINSSSAPDGLPGTRNGSDSPSGRRVHKVGLGGGGFVQCGCFYR